MNPYKGGGDRAHYQLALCADIEQPRSKRQRYRDAGSDERDQEDDGVGDLKGRGLPAAAESSESPAEKALVRGERIGAGGGDDDASDDESEDDRPKWDRQAAPEIAQGREAEAGSAARPRCVGYAGMSAGGVIEPDLIAAWTLSSSACISGVMVRLSSA